MNNTLRITTKITTEEEKKINNLIEKGKYLNKSDVLRMALRSLLEKEYKEK